MIARAEAGRADGQRALPHVLRRGARAGPRRPRRATWASGEQPRPLEGIPIAIKEEEAVAGQPWTQGSLIYKDLVAEESSSFAQRMLDAGRDRPRAHDRARSSPARRSPTRACTASPATRGTRSSPSAARPAARAPRWRRARRRWPAARTSAARSAIPASFNGVVGFKPPYGRVPQAAPFNLDIYCHCGPMARTVADCALFENVLAGPHPPRPRLAAPEARDPRAAATASQGLRIARLARPRRLADRPGDRRQHAGDGRGAARGRRDRRARSTWTSRATWSTGPRRSTSI